MFYFLKKYLASAHGADVLPSSACDLSSAYDQTVSRSYRNMKPLAAD
ncbi:uncharacterized protein G6M90_00g001730 [Metarhizium brunneum]|uniref:Uncharacterized protein n=1 Tax=Metarhizium brunneum TaxID=500148 RepID=A0A7D5UT57_9HYPO|nr:hypothetical protein G6M90_00g001730 [Metarhizium brunneum]